MFCWRNRAVNVAIVPCGLVKFVKWSVAALKRTAKYLFQLKRKTGWEQPVCCSFYQRRLLIERMKRTWRSTSRVRIGVKRRTCAELFLTGAFILVWRCGEWNLNVLKVNSDTSPCEASEQKEPALCFALLRGEEGGKKWLFIHMFCGFFLYVSRIFPQHTCVCSPLQAAAAQGLCTYTQTHTAVYIRLWCRC